MPAGRPRTPTPGPRSPPPRAARPTSYAARIAYARYLLQKNDFPNAIQEFGAAARLDPSQPEPPTYAAWAGALLAQQLKDPKTRQPLLAASLDRMTEVTKTQPKYPDAYTLRGVILYRFEGDAKHAIPAFQQFLLLTDDSNPIRPQVLDVLAQAEKAAGSREITQGDPSWRRCPNPRPTSRRCTERRSPPIAARS